MIYKLFAQPLQCRQNSKRSKLILARRCLDEHKRNDHEGLTSDPPRL